MVRNWYARDAAIVDTEDNLVALAYRCADAFEKGNQERVTALNAGSVGFGRAF